MPAPLLWHFPISHYNEKARWALDWKRIPHERRALAMGYVPRAPWATGQWVLETYRRHRGRSAEIVPGPQPSRAPT